MFEFFPGNKTWSFACIRMLAESYYGGGEFNEIYRTTLKIKPGDQESWHREWRSTAEHVAAFARAEKAAGHTQAARQAFFRASNYYRSAEFFVPHTDQRKIPTYLESRDCFRDAVRLSPGMEIVEVPYEGMVMPGYFFHPNAARSADKPPVLIVTGGADSTAEEVFFIGAPEALRRGFACLIVDGPGRGGMLRLQKCRAIPDFERPVTAMVDYLVSRGDTDTGRMAFVGVSMGGYYVTRAAAYEKRVRACVCHFGPYNVYTDIYQYYEPLKDQFRWLVGANTEQEAKERLSRFTLEDTIGRVECPLLILHGADDYITDPRCAQRIYDEARCEKEFRFMNSGEPGAIHCSYDHHAEIFPFIYDWIASRI